MPPNTFPQASIQLGMLEGNRQLVMHHFGDLTPCHVCSSDVKHELSQDTPQA